MQKVNHYFLLIFAAFLIPNIPILSFAESPSVDDFTAIVNTGTVNQTTQGSGNTQNLNVGSATGTRAKSFNANVTTGAITQSSSGSGIQQSANIGSATGSKIGSFNATVNTGNIEQIATKSGDRQELDLGSVTNSSVTGAVNTNVTIKQGVSQTGAGAIAIGSVKNANVQNFSNTIEVKGKVSGNNIKIGSVVGQSRYDNDGRYVGEEQVGDSGPNNNSLKLPTFPTAGNGGAGTTPIGPGTTYGGKEGNSSVEIKQAPPAIIPLINENNSVVDKIVAELKKSLGSKITDDVIYTIIAKTINAISISSPKIAGLLLSETTINQIAEQILKSSWINEAFKEGPKALLKASPTFISDIVVDATTNIIKDNYPNKTEGQVIAWEIKGGYLTAKSLVLAAGNPGVGAAEFVAGGVQLNLEIWGKVLFDAVPELIEAKLNAFKSQSYADLSDQTNKAMQLYSHAETAEEKERVLGLLKEVFDSIRPSAHPIASIYSTYPFKNAELNEMEKLAISSVKDFDKAKTSIALQLFSSGDSSRANTFLNTYFSHSEKDTFLIKYYSNK